MKTLTTAAAALALPSGVLAQGQKFSREVVTNAARELAAVPFTPLETVPEGLRNLSYEQYRRIVYRRGAAIWGGTPTRFSVEMFAPGSVYNTSVRLSVVENGEAFVVPIDDSQFEVRTADIENPEELALMNSVGEMLESLGRVAGFRLHYPLNTPDINDEFVVFQGASYFRAVSRGQKYGMSARGLAIDVAEPSGEEFPAFTEFWIERPSSRADSIVVHALLDSPRCTGAYRFGIYPDDPTRMDIEATLFARAPLNHVGLGALTSMYMFGEMDRAETPDYRDAVHDSVGLAMLTGGGEYLWRPLQNPRDLQVSSFVDQSPRGFGLAQRDRNFATYQDVDVFYHERPSSWVVPNGDWGAGHVVLVEIPTPFEGNDNIVAYWRPSATIEPGAPFSFSYQLRWPDDTPLPREIARVTRSAYSTKLGTGLPQVVIDYSGLPEGVDVTAIEFHTSISAGVHLETIGQKLGENAVRAFVTFDPQGERMAEIRLQPMHQGVVIGETWLFRWLAS